MDNKPIKVFIVDDSRVARELLTHIIETDPQIKVVGFAENGPDALQWLQNHSCDVITMDIQMPILNGFDVTQKIMETKPTPIVIVSGAYTNTDKQMSFRALEAGALAILEKPIGFTNVIHSEKAKELIETIKTISEIKTVKRASKPTKSDSTSFIPKEKKGETIKAIAIGASLGGPLAICKILSELPETFPVPIYIVQHIAAGFTEGFSKWLQGHAKLRISVAQHQQKAEPCNAYIAGDNCQMVIQSGDVINLVETQHKQPSVGSLFKSMAETYGPNCAGVILTGMGTDGAKELLLMKQKGALTIAQDEQSSLMFGMPKEAIFLGAAEHIMPLENISSMLNDLVNNK